jgi:hypothetical protein
MGEGMRREMGEIGRGRDSREEETRQRKRRERLETGKIRDERMGA